MAADSAGTDQAPAGAKPSARERLLSAANELFYAEGVQTVGIDRIIERAGVAKASLYNTFGSKDELVHAYLRSRHAGTSARILAFLERYETPRARLLGVFDALSESFKGPGYRGCAFIAASAEAESGSSTEQASNDYRAWVRTLFTDLARQAGVPDPQTLGRRLHLLYDGCAVSVRMDADPEAAAAARATAEVLLDAALSAAPERAAAD
ncbi:MULTISPECIES: TetR/AcrR family transcriptional regulator [unclassified Streptomyces]|uniref:TetR/AcrR family transcriptional regulator n=1 Tax=Streptomycetaceae TaxID=2062 RepID=UPI00036307B9|nr:MULTISPECIES: TetR/AcrR family transcriptional regulator [unclassified Streptomyces]MYX37949.1 TetR family transcriptional regulator [Streptomyces sp. SID8377]